MEHARATVPGWFDLMAVGAPLLMLVAGASALLLAFFGVYTLWAALIVGIPLAVVALVAVGRPLLRATPPGKPAHRWALVVVALCLAAAATNGFRPAQHVVVEADPGGYTATAKWLSRDGSLVQEVEAQPFREVGSARIEVPGVYEVGEGRLEFQFNHLSAAILAIGLDLAGPRFMFRLPALAAALGLLPFYAVVARLVRRAWLATACTAALAVSLPFVAFARDTYSEPFTLAVLWAGILMLGLTVERRHPAMALLAGCLLAGTTLARIDGVLYLVPVPLVAAWLVLTGRRGATAAASLVSAAVITYVIGAVDLWVFTGRYASDLAGSRRQLDLLLLASCVVAVTGYVVASRRPRWVDRAAGAAARLAVPVGCAAVVTALAMWWLRPLVQEVHYPTEQWWGSRAYAEQSMWWVSWYLGPVTLALAVAGLGYSITGVMKRRRGVWTAITLLHVVPSAVIYLWRPSITPVHIWAMRRYLPAVLPGVLALAAVAIAWMVTSRPLARLPVVVRRGGAAVAAVGLVAQPLAVTWPVRELQERRGYLIALYEACDLAGDDAAVLVFAGGAWTQSVRSWCGVPAAWANLRAPPSPEQIDELAALWAARCRQLVLLTDDPRSLQAYGSVSQGTVDTSVVGSGRSLARTWERAPFEYQTDNTSLTLATANISPPPGCVPEPAA